jgi:hypothetical protein
MVRHTGLEWPDRAAGGSDRVLLSSSATRYGMVFKKVTVMGTSGVDFENAVDDAVTRAQMTIDNVRWLEVVEQRVQIGELNDREYQVEVEVAFELEE